LRVLDPTSLDEFFDHTGFLKGRKIAIVNHPKSEGFLKGRKIAIVNHPKSDFDRGKFFVACAQAKGYQIAAFQEFEEAVTWLYPPHEP
jgi:hypothetical protein